MKKSKIIVPALGIILLSTVASVTGTVAWFTANTKYNVNVSTFEIGRLTGDLTCNLANVAGTTVDNTVGQAKVELKTKESNVTYNSILGDASYSGSSTTFYSVKGDDRNVTASSGITTFTTVDNGYRNITGETASAAYKNAENEDCLYFYAVSRTMTFKYQFGSTTLAQDLYLNFTADNGTVTQATLGAVRSAGTEGDSTKGFRMAFVTDSMTTVWAPFDSSVGKHVTGTGTSNVVDWGADTASFQSIVTGNTADKKLGQITTDSGAGSTGQLVVTCYAWFEGTDHDNIINSTKIQKITAALGFYTQTH